MTMPAILLPNSPPLDEEKARFTSARIKVLETKLVIYSDLEKLCGMSKDELVGQIKLHHPWAASDPIKFRAQSYEILYKTALDLSKESDTPDLYWFFVLPTVFVQLQSFLEGGFKPEIPVPGMKEFFDKNDENLLPTGLLEVFSKAKDVYADGKQGEARRFLTAQLLEMLNSSRFCNKQYFKDFVSRWSFLVQLRLYVSSLMRKGSLQYVNPDLYDTPEEILSQAKDLGIKNTSISGIELQMENALFAHVKTARMSVAGFDVLFCYLFELTKEFEKIAELLAATTVKTDMRRACVA